MNSIFHFFKKNPHEGASVILLQLPFSEHFAILHDIPQVQVWCLISHVMTNNVTNSPCKWWWDLNFRSPTSARDNYRPLPLTKAVSNQIRNKTPPCGLWQLKIQAETEIYHSLMKTICCYRKHTKSPLAKGPLPRASWLGSQWQQRANCPALLSEAQETF